MNNFTKAVIAMLLSAMGFTLMNVMVKLSGDLPVTQKAIFRNLIAALLSGYLVYRQCASFFGAPQNRFNLVLRSSFGLCGVLLLFWSIDHLLLSDVDMINKMSPFFLIILSAIFLKERVSLQELLLFMLSLFGVLLIIKPTFAADLTPFLVALIGSVFAAAAYLMLRVLALSPTPESPNTIVFFFSAFSTVALLPWILWHFAAMTPRQVIYLLVSGLGATIGQFGITWAYRFAAAKEVSIYAYTSVLFAALASGWLFDEYPDWMSWLGYLFIFAAGFLMFYLQKQQKP